MNLDATQRSNDLPKGVFAVRKPRKTYWYYTPNRGKQNEGRRRRLSDYGSPEWQEEIEGIRREQQGVPALYDVRSLVRDYRLTAAWQQLEPNSRATYEAAIKPILADWRFKRPSEVTVTDVTALVERLSARPASANMTLIVARKLMRYAIQKGLRPDNPARDVDSLDEESDGAKPLTLDAWAALMREECPQALHRLAVLGRFTGQRISDLITMRPRDRDEDGISHKIKKLRSKPHWSLLTFEQSREVDSWNAAADCPYAGKPDGRAYTTDGLRAVWNVYAQTEAGKPLGGFTPHDLRATKVCDERIAGKTHQQIAAMVGMSIQMVMNYSRHIDQRLVARGAEKAARKPEEAARGPMGRIRSLDEAAAYLRAPADAIAVLARHHGIGALFGKSLSFTDEDIRAIWAAAKRAAFET